MTELSPQDQLSRLSSGYWHTQAVYVAAKLGIADALKDGPRSADELAALTQTNPRALYRLLRALASIGIFVEADQHRFALTPMAECLRSDVPGSVRSLAIMRGEWQYEAWGQLLYSIQTGRSAFERIHKMPLFDYLSANPEKGKLFDEAMTGVHGRETSAMLDAYDFAGISVLADIGGGNGEVISSILKKYPAMRGVLFDQPSVIERTRANLEAAGLAARCEVVAGNFFDDVPSGADAYLLRHIIHDWDDEKSVAILRNCRAALGNRGKLLVVEGIVPPGNEASLSKFFDLAMMVLPGGMERTEGEYRRLFEASGFVLTRIGPTKSWISVIEGHPR
ncbi:MAG: acetylserotonin O-methyltransferase [Planctomycetia bacterium]|nr:acetylserotonin O-methyltransferase [Planctomycetia bacterium]